MPYIKVNTKALRSYSDRLESIRSDVKNIRNDLDNLRSNLDWDIKAEEQINSILRDILSDLATERNSLEKMSTFALHASNSYDNIADKNKSMLDDAFRDTKGNDSILEKFLNLKDKYFSRFFDLGLGAGITGSLTDLKKLLFESPFAKIGDMIEDGSSYYDIFKMIAGNGLKDTVDYYADKFKIGLDRASDLGECIKQDLKFAVQNFADGLNTKAVALKNGLSNLRSEVAEFWDNNQMTKRLLGTGKAVFDILTGSIAVAGAVFGTGATAGMAAPAAVLVGTYGANTAVNGFADLYNCWFGDLDDVGQFNALKEASKLTFGAIGGLFGQEAIGEKVGEVVYGVGGVASEIITFKAFLNNSGWKLKVKNANTSRKTFKDSLDAAKKLFSNAAEEGKSFGKTFGLMGRNLLSHFKNSGGPKGSLKDAIVYPFKYFWNSSENIRLLAADAGVVIEGVSEVNDMFLDSVGYINDAISENPNDPTIKIPVALTACNQVKGLFDICNEIKTNNQINNLKKEIRIEGLERIVETIEETSKKMEISADGLQNSSEKMYNAFMIPSES